MARDEKEVGCVPMTNLRTRRLERVRRPLVPVAVATVLLGLSGCSDSPSPLHPRTPAAVYELKDGAPVTAVPAGLFAQKKPVAVSPEDLIEPGDNVEVIVRRGAGEEKYTAAVRANGIITVSFIEVNIKGLSEADAEDRIDKELSAVMKNPRTTVRIVQKAALRPKNFYILGEVKSPGKYQLARRTTLLQAITQGGGYTDIAGLDKIVVISHPEQDKPLVRVANIHVALQTGDLTADLPLGDNDVVFVPRSKMGDWFIYYNKTLLPVLNTLMNSTTVVFLNKILADLFAGPEPQASVAVCWIARVLYGDHAWQVQALRWYIVGPLSEHWYGRAFANGYMRYGPQAAQLLKAHPRLQVLVRPFFDWLLQHALVLVGSHDGPLRIGEEARPFVRTLGVRSGP